MTYEIEVFSRVVGLSTYQQGQLETSFGGDSKSQRPGSMKPGLQNTYSYALIRT